MLKASVSSSRPLVACRSESYSEIAILYDAMRVRNSFRSASINSHINFLISVKRSSEVTVPVSSVEVVSDSLLSATFLSLSHRMNRIPNQHLLPNRSICSKAL